MSSSSAREAFLDSYPDPIPPPPGVVANFNDPNTYGTAFIIVAVIGLFLATIFTCVRIYTKGILTRSLGWDDLACVLTWVLAIAWTALNIKLAGLGMGLQVWNYYKTYRSIEEYSKTALTIDTIYFFAICLVKVTILLLYLRTFTESKRFRYIVYAVLATLVSTHLLTITIVLASITPFYCQWTQFPTDAEYYSTCTTHYNYLPWTVFLAVLTIVLDIIILVLPCPAVWRLHMAKRQKIAIILLLVAGVVVTIASILRLAFLLHRFYYDSDFTNIYRTEFQVNIISTVEIDVAIICASLPTLKAFLKRFVPKVLGTSVNKPSAFGYRKSTLAAQPSGISHADRKWQSDSHEERLTAPYVELDEDGKSNKSYAMESIQPQSAQV